LDVGSSFGTDFFKEDIVLLCEFFSFTFVDVLVLEVDFVGKKSNDDPFSSLVFHVIDPLLHTFERISISDVVHNDSDRGISNVVRYQSFESLLPSRIPELKPDGFIFKEDVLRDKIDTDGGSLRCAMSTC
jgi:hypothetical protein